MIDAVYGPNSELPMFLTVAIPILLMQIFIIANVIYFIGSNG